MKKIVHYGLEFNCVVAPCAAAANAFVRDFPGYGVLATCNADGRVYMALKNDVGQKAPGHSPFVPFEG
jgi:hypothetical protein